MKLTVKQAVKQIQNNQIVALPTETVYGLFGLASSTEAVNRVFVAKNRPKDNPLICHFHSFEQIKQHTSQLPEYLETLVKHFCPGPITFVLNLNQKSNTKPALANLNTICCRIPNHPTTLDILKEINEPLFGPSANTSTQVSGVFAQMIEQDLGDRIAGIVDGGICDIGLESTIINCQSETEIRILRPGAIGKIELEQALAKKFGYIQIIENATSANTIPGAKYKHYSPKTNVKLLQTNDIDLPLIGLDEDLNNCQNKVKISLGSQQNLQLIAHNLFLNLYKLDQLGLKDIYFLESSWKYLQSNQNSLSKAIVNRLSKVIQE
jgi:L-threonylcarbamoyladenylate synthase